MGTKVPVSDITNILNSSGLSVLNADIDALSDAFDQVLFRDGTLPMDGNIDMDSNRIINLPAPSGPTEPLRLADANQLGKGDPGGNVMSVGLKTSVISMEIDTGTDLIQTTGHTEIGRGSGMYIADSLATITLFNNHPKACVKDANNRYFRLMGDAEGFVTMEQFGCLAYSAGVNQQSYVQAALDYCKAVGLKGIKFTEPKYEFWVPTHIGSFTDYNDDTGNYLVIDEWSCSLISTHPRGTIFDCKGPTGGNKLTDYQVINSATYGGDVIWRGAAVKLCGSVNYPGGTYPGADNVSNLYMKGITFYTGITAALSSNWPCHPPSRTPGRENAWDISNKGIWCQNDKWVGDITLIDCGFDGFLGEHIYCGGSEQRLFVRNFRSLNTNGSSFNPNGPKSVDVDGAYCENVIGVAEGWMSREYGRFVNVIAKKVAGGGEIKGGYEYDSDLLDDGRMPWLDVNVTLEGNSASSSLYIGSFCRGRIHLIDMFARIHQQSATMVVENINVDLVVTSHLYSPSRAVYYVGYDTTTSVNIRNTTIRLDVRRTYEAQAASRWVLNTFEQYGSIGANNVLIAQGYTPTMGTVSSPANNYVTVMDRGLDKSWGTYGTAFDPTTTASPDWSSGYLRCATFSGGAGVYTVNLPSTSLYGHGAEIGITHRTSNSVFVEIRQPGISYPCALIGYQNSAKFRCNKATGAWDIIEAPRFQRTTGAVDIASTALAGEAGPYTLTVTGIRPYHSYDVLPQSTMGGFDIQDVQVTNDTVKFWVKNRNGTDPEDPASISFAVRWGILP